STAVQRVPMTWPHSGWTMRWAPPCNGQSRPLARRAGPDPPCGCGSARRGVATGHAFGREHDLPQVVPARAEAGHRTGQVEPPHATEALVVPRRQVLPGRFDVVAPGLQRPVVVGAEVVPVLDHEAALQRPRG